MATIKEAYQSIADVNLWLKTRGGDDLVLADIPSIIPLRWSYFRDNWEFIKQGLLENISQDPNPDFFNEQISDFSKFIESQRTTTKINPFQDSQMFHRFYSIFNNILIQNISLTNEEQKLIDSELIRIDNFSKNNFKKAKQDVIDFRDRITDTYGLADETYNKSYNKNSIPPQITATIVEINYLATLEQSIRTCDFILANLFAVDAAIDPFALARANANNPNIAIGSYQSGNLVKLNYGESLEGLANRYLGHPDKWIDIAIANGLKPPYIDEIGIRVPLLSNGSSNQINLAETDINGNLNIDRLYINQQILLQSNIEVVADQRSIVNIRQVPVSGEIILELDGNRNMSDYKTIDQAHIRVFAPNTVNSGTYVLIPSNEPLPNTRKEEVPWFLAKSAEDEKRSKVDLALNPDGDLIFTANGDVRLSYGLDNAIQAIKLKMITEFGSLRYHPSFGFINISGSKNLDTETIKSLIVESINSQIEADSRFDRIENLAVDYLHSDQTVNGVGAMLINLTVKMAGGSQVIPISFTVNNS